jgi:hypothetical protein
VAYPAKVVFPNAVAITMSESYRKTHVIPDDTNGVTEAYSYGSYYRNGVSRYFHDVFKTTSGASVEAFGKQYQVATDLARFNLMTLSIESRTVMETNYLSTQEPSYVAVFGSTEFASDTILDSAAYGNADVLTATLRHMGREVMPANLEFKAFKVYTVDTNAYKPDVPKTIRTTAFMTLRTICTTSSFSPISSTHLRSAFMTISAIFASTDAMNSADSSASASLRRDTSACTSARPFA